MEYTTEQTIERLWKRIEHLEEKNKILQERLYGKYRGLTEDRVEVLRIVRYEGPRSLIEKQVQQSLHGSREGWTGAGHPDGGIVITAETIGEFPRVVQLANAQANPQQEEPQVPRLEKYEKYLNAPETPATRAARAADSLNTLLDVDLPKVGGEASEMPEVLEQPDAADTKEG